MQAAAAEARQAAFQAAEDKGIQWKEIHSLVRWNKLAEMKSAITSPVHANCVDDSNGNYCIHIAAQNGHKDAVEFLLQSGATVNVQNGTGQTPLHMAVAYDFDAVAALLKDNGADGDIQNWEGHPAKFGIDGDKDPSDPCNLLEQATSTQEAMDALDAMLHRDGLDRAQVAMLGMQVKKGNKALAKADWTPECQAKLADVIKALD